MKRLIKMIVLIFPVLVYGQDLSELLIVEDIGNYKKITKGGPSGDILAGADHFSEDHEDASYGIAYLNKQVGIWIDVQVTLHSGSDSDRWLLHEVEDGYRDPDVLKLVWI